MKKYLRIFALLLAVGSVLVWVGLGANGGWTRTSVPVKTVDEVTGIEAISYERKFVPGLDSLGAALLVAGLLGSVSFLFPKQKNIK